MRAKDDVAVEPLASKVGQAGGWDPETGAATGRAVLSAMPPGGPSASSCASGPVAATPTRADSDEVMTNVRTSNAAMISTSENPRSSRMA